jgi:tripartite-type tricarboxylate transporter receptor subunit TctC
VLRQKSGRLDTTAIGGNVSIVRSLLAGLVAALAAWPSCILAEDYPTRAVRIVVPQSAGGATDTFARAIGQKLSERWKQPVVIENRAGAAGVIGTERKRRRTDTPCW